MKVRLPIYLGLTMLFVIQLMNDMAVFAAADGNSTLLVIPILLILWGFVELYLQKGPKIWN